MLILTRKVREEVCIGDEICVTVLKVRGTRVHLGVSGPPDVDIYRKEIRRRRVLDAGESEEAES